MPKNGLPRKTQTTPARNLWWRGAMKLRSLVIVAGVSVLFGFVSSQSYATCKIDITEYAGWKIDLAGKMTNYRDKNISKQHNFDGCKDKRTLIINHSLEVTCLERTSNTKISTPIDVVLVTDGEKKRACINDQMIKVQYRIPR